MSTLRKLVKNSILQIRKFDDNRDRNNKAREILKVAENEKGKLSQTNKRLCDEYAKDVLGSKTYAPWLYTYTAFAGKFKEGWIPDNYYGQHVMPNVNGDYGPICNNKVAIESLINVSNSIDICYYVNDLFLDKKHKILKENSIKNLLLANNDKIVFKLESSQQGKGIFFFDKSNLDINNIKKLGNGVFQTYIKQHSFFLNFTRNSVATIRLISVCKNNGEIDIRGGYFRFGRDLDTHVISSSAIRIPINIKNGILDSSGYLPNWKSMKKLPNNDYSFAQAQLPQYNKCVSEIKRMHSNIPFARCLGWDLIVDNNNNVVVIEVNGKHPGVTFIETVQGPCFKGLGWENLHKTN
jgi:hypothetical protein